MASEDSFPSDKCKVSFPASSRYLDQYSYRSQVLHKDALRCEQPKAPESPWCHKHQRQKDVIYGLT